MIFQEVGLSELREGAAGNSLRSILSTLTLLMFHLYITVILGEESSAEKPPGYTSFIHLFAHIVCLLYCLCFIFLPLGTGEGNLEEAEILLEPYKTKFPNVSSIFITSFFCCLH